MSPQEAREPGWAGRGAAPLLPSKRAAGKDGLRAARMGCCSEGLHGNRAGLGLGDHFWQEGEGVELVLQGAPVPRFLLEGWF